MELDDWDDDKKTVRVTVYKNGTNAGAKAVILQGSFDMFLEEATDKLELKEKGKRLFDECGKEIVTLTDVNPGQVIFVSCGEPFTAFDDTTDETKSSRRRRSSDGTRAPANPFNVYSKIKREEVTRIFPHLKHNEISSKLGEMWRELPKEQRKVYEEEFHVQKTLAEFSQRVQLGMPLDMSDRFPSGFELFLRDRFDLDSKPSRPYLSLLGNDWRNAPQELRESYNRKALLMSTESTDQLHALENQLTLPTRPSAIPISHMIFPMFAASPTGEYPYIDQYGRLVYPQS
eukprot:TRINITY_DN27778_c0_g1_i1.p1 TRINITY_DN27778_c0_g1~~TRINITY_DN27778_c0_g1_i1.p1  ORF type:complete len:314 (-),score=77.67 TRINITY_DN27778_c0_g1_i1:47-910(-)